MITPGKPITREIEIPKLVDLSPRNPNQKWQIIEQMQIPVDQSFLDRGFYFAEKVALSRFTKPIGLSEFEHIAFQHIPLNPTPEHIRSLEYQLKYRGVDFIYLPDEERSDSWTISAYENEWLNKSSTRYNQVSVGPQGQIVAIFTPTTGLIDHSLIVINDTAYETDSTAIMFAIRENGYVSTVLKNDQGEYTNTIIKIEPEE